MENSIDVILEHETDDDVLKVDLILNFSVQPAEPDVGIMSDYVEEYEYVMLDGSAPDPIYKLDEIDTWVSPLGVYPVVFKNPELQRWHERNLEDALESLDYDPDYTY